MPNKLDDLRTDMNKCEGKLQGRYISMEIAMKIAIEYLSKELAAVQEAKIELEEKENQYYKFLTEKEK
jgi:hypothetical protein